MKKFLFQIFLSLLVISAKGSEIDSLNQLLKKTGRDTARVSLMLEISKQNFSNNPENAIAIATDALKLSQEISYKKGIALSYKNIGRAYYNLGDYLQTLDFWHKSAAYFDSIGDQSGVANLQSNLGAVYFNQGDDANALEYYLKALKTAERINDTLRIVTTCINIGGVYSNKKATQVKSVEYYKRALPLSEKLGDQDAIGTVTVNLGEYYLDKNSLDTALFYFNKSLKAFEGSEHTPYSLINIGKVYRKRKDYVNAEKFQLEAYNQAKNLDSKNDMALALLGLAETYEDMSNLNGALDKFLEAKKISEEIGANYQLKASYEGLSNTYAKLSDFKNAYKYQNLLTTIKDTLFNLDIEKKLGTLQFSFDIEKKESEISLLTKDKEIQQQEIKRQKIVRNSFIGGFAIVLLFAGVFLSQRNRISKEKKRSEELLLNILPEETAEELKATGSAKAKSFDSISVLFTDFKNFTQASEILSAQELVEEINQCYSEFDRIITKHGLEKIKTIGDSYMCAGGLPVASTDHAERIVRAGLEMQDFIEVNKERRIQANLPYFELRLGIHSGPVVAGVVGTKKFAYDIWGDTVNTASRMESSGAVGKVNISEATYELVKNKFRCISRGRVAAKNKGEIEMYFVEGPLS